MAQRATILDGTVTFEKVATASDEIGLLESTPAFFFSTIAHSHRSNANNVALILQKIRKKKKTGNKVRDRETTLS